MKAAYFSDKNGESLMAGPLHVSCRVEAYNNPCSYNGDCGRPLEPSPTHTEQPASIVGESSDALPYYSRVTQYSAAPNKTANSTVLRFPEKNRVQNPAGYQYLDRSLRAYDHTLVAVQALGPRRARPGVGCIIVGSAAR